MFTFFLLRLVTRLWKKRGQIRIKNQSKQRFINTHSDSTLTSIFSSRTNIKDFVLHFSRKTSKVCPQRSLWLSQSTYQIIMHERATEFYDSKTLTYLFVWVWQWDSQQLDKQVVSSEDQVEESTVEHTLSTTIDDVLSTNMTNLIMHHTYLYPQEYAINTFQFSA